MKIEKRGDKYFVSGGPVQFPFDTLYEAGCYCESNNYEIEDNAEGVGFKLGSLIVAIDAGTLSVAAVVAALIESTDEAYLGTARKVARGIMEVR